MLAGRNPDRTTVPMLGGGNPDRTTVPMLQVETPIGSLSLTVPMLAGGNPDRITFPGCANAGRWEPRSDNFPRLCQCWQVGTQIGSLCQCWQVGTQIGSLFQAVPMLAGGNPDRITFLGCANAGRWEPRSDHCANAGRWEPRSDHCANAGRWEPRSNHCPATFIKCLKLISDGKRKSPLMTGSLHRFLC